MAAAAIVACAPMQTGTTARTVAPSSELVGKVLEVGADPATWLVIQPDGGPQLRIGGPSLPSLRNTLGATAWVRGAMVGAEFRVDVFEIRRVGEQAVDDGYLSATGDALTLMKRNGASVAVPNATPALRALAGSRVWISRPVPGVTPSYGVITPK